MSKSQMYFNDPVFRDEIDYEYYQDLIAEEEVKEEEEYEDYE